MIIEDEPSSQQVLEKFIEKISYLELIATCSDALEALEQLQKTEVELLFLDINMPKVSGISFYKSLKNPPKVIFTTAYPEYAVQGFELNAVDYLLKPFSFERFLTAVNKAMDGEKIEERALMVKSEGVIHKISTNDIVYIEALGDYIKIQLQDQYLIVNESLINLRKRLSQDVFVQLHRSYLVNIYKVTAVMGNQVFCEKKALPIGRMFRESFLQKWIR